MIGFGKLGGPITSFLTAAVLCSACSSGAAPVAPAPLDPPEPVASPAPPAVTIDGDEAGAPSSPTITADPAESASCVGEASESSVDTAVAAERYLDVIPRIDHTSTFVFRNLRYEGNNPLMREAAGAGEPDPSSGLEVAQRWQRMLGSVEGVFLLRDSLWSQQDHPYRNEGLCALMLPPNWVTTALAIAEPEPPTTPPVEDDSAWAELASDPSAVFGDYPSSDTLHRLATEMPSNAADQTLTRNARVTITELASLIGEVVAVKASEGSEAAMERAGQLIAASDRVYFGASRSRAIPIMVPNIGAAEAAEGKGFEVPGLATSEQLRDQIAVAIYRHRLADGDLALERYDLSDSADVDEAIETLEQVLDPSFVETGTLWLWINGPLDPDQKLQGVDPLAYFPAFNERLANASIDRDRLRFVSKPTVEFDSTSDALAEFQRAVDTYAASGLPLSVNVDAAGLRALIEG